MAKKTPVLSQLAEEILADASAGEAFAKVAAVSPAPAHKTEFGEQLLKLASELRNSAPAVTYADIQEFRKRYGI